MFTFCCDERRRDALTHHPALRGLDFVEVSPDQSTLSVHFVPAAADSGGKAGTPAGLTPANFRVTGGARVRDITVLAATYRGDVLELLVDDDGDPTNGVGDFSFYTLRLVDVPDIDPGFSEVAFSFKVGCPSPFDCRRPRACPPEARVTPEIDYLAKDWASFRRVMLDRLAQTIPEWTERNPADLGVALVETLAYVADHLSYRQDVIATEAYLGTARRRASVRRHARLVDYFMHEGANARAWVHVRVEGDLRSADPALPVLPAGTQLLTRLEDESSRLDFEGRLPSGSPLLAKAAAVFETMEDAFTLVEAHNEMRFHTWGDRECCLPQGSTRATLEGDLADLAPGQVLVFEEVLGPKTGAASDADTNHRHAVRLVSVTRTEDPLGGRFADPPDDGPRPVTVIDWHPDDALPFALCLSTGPDTERGLPFIAGVSVARGNIVLADHGRTIVAEPLPEVPGPTREWAPETADSRCAPSDPRPVRPRYRPGLEKTPLTHAAPYDPTRPPVSAARTMRWDAGSTVPAVFLIGTLGSSETRWTALQDLLGSGPADPHFVVETEADGRATLRFGDGEHGDAPPAGTRFAATYRAGSGASGNIGADTLAHVASTDSGVLSVRNPLPARGGLEPESIEHVRQSAPWAFRTQQRAVTRDDYSEVTERRPDIQKAASAFRWTGSWHTVFVSADRLGGRDVDPGFRSDLTDYLDLYRMAGQDVGVDIPIHVPLEVEMEVCVCPGHARSDVERALMDLFSSRALPDGRRGLFHPDNFTFGQAVYLSPLVAAAQSTEGVCGVTATVFRRDGDPASSGLEAGFLPLGRLEIPELAGDPDFPERGTFTLRMEGGL